MKNCKAIICCLLATIPAFIASTASAALQNAITVPWEGDVTKFHTVVSGQPITLKGVLWATNPPISYTSYGVPQAVTFTLFDTGGTCGYDGEFTFLINGIEVATNGLDPSCTCTPPVDTVTVSGATLSNAWTAASPPIVEVQYSGGPYVSWVEAYLDWGGGTNYTDCMFVAPGNSCGDSSYVCSYYTSSAFDVTLNVGNIVNPTPTSVQYQWNPGDGNAYSSLVSASVVPGTPYPAPLTYTYSGSAGTPYVAWLIASDGTTTISNRYLVMVQPAGLDANINMGIDNGLWWLYQNANFSDGSSSSLYNYLTYDGSPCAGWTSYGSEVHAGPTASAVQAFEINGSLKEGNWNQDPYAQVVAYGLNFLLKGYYVNQDNPMLRAIDITSGGTTSEGNPDGNGNGIGVEVYDGLSLYYPIYQGGMIVDSLVASGTPNASTGRQFVGGYTALYQDVVQDMLDAYAWGQYTGTSSFNVLSYNPPINLTTLGTPDSLTFDMEDFTYGGTPGNYTFNLNGVTVGTDSVSNETTCYPGIHSVTVTGSALSNAWNNGASPPTIEVIYSGNYYVCAVDWVLDFGGTSYTNVVFDAPGHDGLSDSYGCDGYSGSAFDVVQDLTSFALPPMVVSSNGVLGGWRYNWGNFPDNSTSQWAAIANLPAQQAPWNCILPSFVRDYNNNWLWYSYADQNTSWGKFGYTGANVFVGPAPNGVAETPSGLVQLNDDGMPTTDYRWSKVENYFQNNWDMGENWFGNALGNFYSIYSFAKSQRTALPNPVVTFPNGFDWYRGNASHNGVATSVSQNLVTYSYWPSTYWEGTELATAWAVIVLKPNLFSAGPTACFSANPNPGFPNVPITFDPSCSTDPQPGGIANLVKFDWNWGDGTSDTITTTPAVVQHAFACANLPCAYPVTLTVYDNSNPQLSASAEQIINITQPPHPPVAVPGGPYIVSLCPGDTLTLNGSGSFSPDAGLSQSNCNTCPPDGLTAYGWALKGAPYVYTDSTNKIDDLGTNFTDYFPNPDTYNIGLQVADNAARSFPEGTPTNLIGDAFATVTVYGAGPCQVTATPGCQSVSVSWNDIGAASYNILSSTSGPDSGFTVAGTVESGVTNTTIAASVNEVEWIRVQGISENGVTTMSSWIEVTNTVADCVCIEDLSASSKSTLVELQWQLLEGATSYNVYRSTAQNVLMVPANRIATGAGTSHGVYVNSGLINGRTYYYRISAVVNGVETCSSITVSAKPAAVTR
jgi:hypothetical protein